MIANGEVEQEKITKSVLVIDEAQDMDANEFALIRALIDHNDDMRVIAVGDDDQNIFEFRGSDSANMQALIEQYHAVRYEMVENYRSAPNIVSLANWFAKTIRNRMKTIPIEAVQKENGIVKIVSHSSEHLEIPIVRELADTYHGGSACVLTETNEEALHVLGLLTKEGIRAKLIQSLDGFRLYDLAEVRFFLKRIDSKLGSSPVISQEIWNQAKKDLENYYSGSSCLENVRNLISDFETVYPNSKYRTDLEEFIKESKLEDFYSDDRKTVFVSTVHKSKGREFDNVYLMLSHSIPRNDSDRRKIYVALTRAKKCLFIHCNTDLFDRCQVPDLIRSVDENQYQEPEEITVQLTHRDVVLDYFKNKKETIFKLHNGDRLSLENDYFSAEIEGKTIRVAKLSKSCAEELENRRQKGYHFSSASVQFVVAWKGKEDTEETAVLLPVISLIKKQ